MIPGVILPLEAYRPPGVEDYIFDEGWPIAGISWMNKPFWQAVIAAALVIGLWWMASRRLEVVPGKRQVVAEYLYDFIRNGIAREVLGRDYRSYLPYLAALFSFILVNNLFGEFFLFMFPTFSNVGYVYGLAAMTFLIYVGSGFRKHGLGYLKLALFPPQVPKPLYILLVPLEFISNFVTRPLTLALRLFANLFGGHLVILLFVVGGAHLLTYSENLVYNVAGGLSLLLAFPVLVLEVFIAALQAYIFTVLTAQYVASSLADEH